MKKLSAGFFLIISLISLAFGFLIAGVGGSYASLAVAAHFLFSILAILVFLFKLIRNWNSDNSKSSVFQILRTARRNQNSI